MMPFTFCDVMSALSSSMCFGPGSTPGFEIVGSIQSKPGVEPGPKHIEELKALITSQKVKGIIVDNFYDPAVPNALARDTGVKVAVVPGQPGGEAGTDDYVQFIGFVIDRLVEAAK